MKKKTYRKPSIRIVTLRIEGHIASGSPIVIPGGGDNNNLSAEVKRYKPIIIDDEEDEEWGQSTYLSCKTFLKVE